MKTDFDEIIDRSCTSSMKWEKYEGTDIIPMWVADMDFKAPPVVLDELKKCIDHGVFGYTNTPKSLYDVTIERLAALYNWEVKKEELFWIPGVVTGLNVVCNTFGDAKNNIVTTVPIYPPFLSAPENCNQKLVTVPMMDKNQRMTFDFDKLEQAFSDNASVFLLCNPYNPGGMIFTREELDKIVDLCSAYNVLICSDEIHSDFILDKDKNHIPTATLSEKAAQNSITLMAPSKTYNIPGFGCSFAVIKNNQLQSRFSSALKGIIPSVNIIGLNAAQAAYAHGDDWLAQMISYLRKNRDLVMKRVNGMKGCRLNHIEATYLAWIDISDTGIDDPVKFFEAAGVGLSDGVYFGQKGFVRLNFGCPQAILEKGLGRMEKALNSAI